MAFTTIVGIRNMTDFPCTVVNFEHQDQTDGAKGQFSPGEAHNVSISVPWCGDGLGFSTRHIDITLNNFVIGTTPVGPRVFTIWQAQHDDGDRVRVSMDGLWHDPGDIVGAMAAVGIVESWVLWSDQRILYVTNDAIWLFPWWFLSKLDDLMNFARSDGPFIISEQQPPNVSSVPKLSASAFSMAGVPSDAFDNHQPDARFLYRDSGKRYEFKIANGVVQVQPPLSVPSITGGAPVPALTQAISYDQHRAGDVIAPQPQFDLVAANGGRVFAKEKDSNRFFFAILDEMFIHSTLDLPEFAVPSVYFKLDPEFNLLGRSKQDLMRPLQGVFGRHPAATRFAAYRTLLDYEVAPVFVVRVKRGAWHLIDARPAPVMTFGETATKLANLLRSNQDLVNAVPELFRRLQNWANMMQRPVPPTGTPYQRRIQYGFASRDPVWECSVDQAIQKVLDIGVGHVHYHQQYEGRWGSRQWLAGVAGGEFQLVFGLFQDNPFPDHVSLYQFFNGPVTDLDGYNDGTCNYYVLAQLINSKFALLYLDEQSIFSARWRLVDPDDFLGTATALAGDLAAFPTGYTPVWQRSLYWSPFAAQLIGPTSRLAVSTQVVLVSGDRDKEPNTIYSINFSYGSCDQTWRWRRLPGSATPIFFTSDAEAAAELIPAQAGDTVYPQTIRLRDDLTIHVNGTRGGVIGRWYQRYLPPSNQLVPMQSQLAGGRPANGFQHPWKFMSEPAFRLADRFSHFGVYDQVDSRTQYYPVQPATSADATALAAVAANPGDRWSDVVWTQTPARPPDWESGWRKGAPQLSIQTFGFTVDKLQLPWPPFSPFLRDTAMCPASLFNPEMLLRIVWRDTRWIAMRRDKRDDDLAPFDNLPKQIRIQNKAWDKTATITLQPAVRISYPPAVQTAYFWITGSDAVIAFSAPMVAVPLDNVYRVRMAALGAAPGQVISLLDVTSAQLQSNSGYYQYRWTPSAGQLAAIQSYCSGQGEMQSGTSVWFEDVVGHVAVPEQVIWQRSPWIEVCVTPSVVPLGTPTQITIYAVDGGTGAPLTGQVIIGGALVGNTGSAFSYTFGSSPGSGVIRVGGYVETSFSINVMDLAQMRAAVRNLAFGIFVGRVRAGGRYFGDSWSDWFAAKAQLGIPPNVNV